MEAKKFIIRYGCNDFVFEGSVLELTNIVRVLDMLTPVLYDLEKTGFKETILQRKLRIFSAKEEAEADDTIYVIGDTRYLL